MGSDIHAKHVLGLNWNTEIDNFTFKLKFNKTEPDIINGARRPMKCQVLRVIMSVYDPLGFLSHLVRAKILLQDVWRTEIGWGNELPEGLKIKWCYWLTQLKKITDMLIPRYYAWKCQTVPTFNCMCSAMQVKAFVAVA